MAATSVLVMVMEPWKLQTRGCRNECEEEGDKDSRVRCSRYSLCSAVAGCLRFIVRQIFCWAVLLLIVGEVTGRLSVVAAPISNA